MARRAAALGIGLGFVITRLGSLTITGFFALLGYQCFMWFKTGSWPSYELRVLWGSKPVLVYWFGPRWFGEWLEQTPLSFWVLLLGLALMVGGMLLGAEARRSRR